MPINTETVIDSPKNKNPEIYINAIVMIPVDELTDA